jgi:hypothetical protein
MQLEFIQENNYFFGTKKQLKFIVAGEDQLGFFVFNEIKLEFK